MQMQMMVVIVMIVMMMMMMLKRMLLLLSVWTGNSHPLAIEFTRTRQTVRGVSIVSIHHHIAFRNIQIVFIAIM